MTAYVILAGVCTVMAAYCAWWGYWEQRNAATLRRLSDQVAKLAARVKNIEEREDQT